MKRIATAAVAALLVPGTAWAAPGMGGEVYGTTVSKGEIEFESSYDRLTGGPDSGADVLSLEAGFGLTSRLRVAVIGEFEKEAGSTRRAEAIGIEAKYYLGKAGGIDFAVYGEYAIGLHGPDKLETKLLMQHRSGPWDLRLNLNAEKPLVSRAPLEFGYAASVDVEAIDEVRLGAQAFGELGSTDRLLPRSEHFVGPVAKIGIEGLGPELGLEVGYLFALDKARDDADGQLRIKLGLEF